MFPLAAGRARDPRPYPEGTPRLITIGIACLRHADREMIPTIRRMLNDRSPDDWSSLVGEVVQIQAGSNRAFPTEEDCVNWLRANPASRLLIASEPLAQHWPSLMSTAPFEGELIVLQNLRPQTSPRYSMRASLLRSKNVTIAGPAAAGPIRKAVRRLSIRSGVGSARVIDSAEDMDRYLRLRYIVWKNSGYLRADRIARVYPVEVEYSDRASIPVGVFSNAGELVACARLVREIGNQETRHARFIQQLVSRSNDPVVLASFAPPQRLKHPFDILDEFHGFQRCYADLVKARIAVGEVSRVAVLPSYGRRGIGEALVDCIVDLAVAYKLKKLFLACPESRIELYERSGFKVKPALRSAKFLHIPQPSVVMERDLEPDSSIARKD